MKLFLGIGGVNNGVVGAAGPGVSLGVVGAGIPPGVVGVEGPRAVGIAGACLGVLLLASSLMWALYKFKPGLIPLGGGGGGGAAASTGPTIGAPSGAYKMLPMSETAAAAFVVDSKASLSFLEILKQTLQNVNIFPYTTTCIVMSVAGSFTSSCLFYTIFFKTKDTS